MFEPDVLQTVTISLRLFVHSNRLKGVSDTRDETTAVCIVRELRQVMGKDGEERLRYNVIAQLEIAYGKVQDSTRYMRQ